MKTKNDFEFNYSAPSSEERKEIENIRNSYLSQGSSTDAKLAQLRKIDKKVKNTPTIVALILGTVGLLVFGLGMSMALEWESYVAGAIVSAVGLISIILAHPVYKLILKKLKNKYSKQILQLSEELLSDENKQN